MEVKGQMERDLQITSPLSPQPQRGESLEKCCSRGGVSTYGGHGLDGFQEMENPLPPPQREESLAKFRSLDGVSTYGGTGSDGAGDMKNPPPPLTQKGKSLAKFLLPLPPDPRLHSEGGTPGQIFGLPGRPGGDGGWDKIGPGHPPPLIKNITCAAYKMMPMKGWWVSPT